MGRASRKKGISKEASDSSPSLGVRERAALPEDHWTHQDPDRHLWTPSQLAQAQQASSRAEWDALYGGGDVLGGRVSSVAEQGAEEPGDWREEFTEAFRRHNGLDKSPNSYIEVAAPFYDMPIEEQIELIRSTINNGFQGATDGELFEIGATSVVYGKVRVIDEDADGSAVRPETHISVYREVWEPTGEVGADGTPRFTQRADELLAEVEDGDSISTDEATMIRQALLDYYDWISPPEDS